MGLTPDKLAAKFMGRWRNGVPLTLSPDSDNPIAADRMNQFLFQGLAPDQSQPDPKGFGCPAGSHIRRGNPRDDNVAGGFTQQARVPRHNLSYGPPHDPTQPNDGEARGLIGYFHGSSFSAQFELLMRFWVNTAGFTPGIQGRDPIIGANDPAKSRFMLPTSPPPSPTVKGFERFVNTRGSAYCFFPSVAGLQYIAAL